MAAWVEQTKRTYFGNATAVRDYRVQLRGNRSVMLFGIYLVALIGVAMIDYGQASNGNMGVVAAQRQLHEFYTVVMAMLAAMIMLVTPALTATTVVTERQRHSFDLIFSAPVPPKYFLVGKMIASFRYTWMLLVLSLPVTAACVVLGGASWTDVLGAFFLLSLNGLIFTSISLLISTLAPRAVSAIIWSYGATFVYCFATSGFASALLFRPGVGMGAAANEAPFVVGLSPFYAFQSTSTYTVIAGLHVPNYLLVALFALCVSKLALLTAGAILTPFGGKEIVSLRIHGLVYATAITVLLISQLPPHIGLAPGLEGGILLGWLLAPTIVFAPFLTCYGYDSEVRYWPNGLVSFRKMLDGTPAGGLPYLLALVLCVAVAVLIGLQLAGAGSLDAAYFAYVLYVVGFWAFFWSVGRWTSSLLLGVKTARTMQFGVFIILCVLPLPVLSAGFSDDFSSSYFNVWDFWILRPLTQNQSWRATEAGAYGVGLLVLAAMIGVTSEARLAKKLAARRPSDEGSVAAA